MDFLKPSKSRFRAKILITGVSKTSDHIQIKIKTCISGQEHPGSSKDQNQNLKSMDALYTSKIKIESQNSEVGCIKDQWPYQNQDQDAKPKSGTSSILSIQKAGLKEKEWSLHLQSKDREPNQDKDVKSQSGTWRHWFSLHLQNQDREPKFGSWVCQRPVIISKSRSRCKAPAGTSSILQSHK